MGIRGTGDNFSRFWINVDPDSATPYDQSDKSFVITANGNVGIGIVSPANILHAAHATNPALAVTDTTNSVKSKLQSTDTIGLVGTESNHNFRLRTNNTDRVAIDTNGNVGIGINSPSYRLHVSGGTSYLSGKACIGAGCTLPTGSDLYVLNSAQFNNTAWITGNAADTASFTHGIYTSSGSTWTDVISNRKGATIQHYSTTGGTVQTSVCFTNSASGVDWDCEVMFRPNATSLFEHGTATGTVDLAEYFPISINATVINEGDVVTVDQMTSAPNDITLANSDTSLPLGIISTNPGYVLGAEKEVIDESLENKKQTETLDDRKLVALAGRVPTKVVVDPETEILEGAPLSVGSITGFAQKATKTGYIVGQSLQSTATWKTCSPANSIADIIWPEDDGTNPANPCYLLPDGSRVGKIMVFVNIAWHDPSATLNDTGQLVINGDAGNYSIANNGNAVETIGAFAELVAAKIQSGLLSTKELVVETRATIADLSVDSLTIGGVPLRDYIASTVSQLGTGSTATDSASLVSPVAELGNLEVTGETLLANLLVTQDATFSGTLNTDALTANTLTATTTLLGELTTQTATVEGTLTVAEIQTDSLNTDTILAATISAYSTRLALLESRTAEFEHMKAQTAELLEATVSGTLYADNIHGFDSKIASAFNEPTITDILKDKVFNSINTTQNSLEMVYDTIALAGYEASSSADLNLTLADVASQEGGLNLGGATAFIDKYFKVNGIAYVADTLGVGNKLMIGQGTTIADGIIEYTALAGTEQTLAIQPSGRGSLTLMAGLMTLTENGNVIIDGNLAVAGNLAVQDTLLANLVQPADFGNPFQVQVAGISDDGDSVKESRFEIINETGTPVATISAEGRADFAAGIGVGSEELDGSDDAEANTNKTSGRATILAGQSELTIRSKRIGSNSLVYVTPVGSTQNQVLYVKSQRPDDPDTPDNEGKFVVGFDQPVTEDVQFNWWIVN